MISWWRIATTGTGIAMIAGSLLTFRAARNG